MIHKNKKSTGTQIRWNKINKISQTKEDLAKKIFNHSTCLIE
jgi:hypothetical protein